MYIILLKKHNCSYPPTVFFKCWCSFTLERKPLDVCLKKCALCDISFNFLFFHPIATEPPFIMAVKEDGLWSKPLNSFGPGEFLSSDIKNVSGKCQVPLHFGMTGLYSPDFPSYLINQWIKHFGIKSIMKGGKIDWTILPGTVLRKWWFSSRNAVYYFTKCGVTYWFMPISGMLWCISHVF